MGNGDYGRGVQEWERPDFKELLPAFNEKKAEHLIVGGTVDTHKAALKIAEKQGYGIYDALVVASALDAGREALYSKDLQDGRTINGQVTVRNQFAP